MVARDEGPGIEDLERALTDGYTTGGGLGLGLPGARRLVDEFDIETAPGEGTTVTLVKWAQRVPEELARRARPRRRRARRTRARRARATWRSSSPTAAGALACVIDGLGHGPEAADAAELCARRGARARRGRRAQELLQACHEALLETRGVVMTVAWFDLERSQLSWAGVGNVDARLVRSGPGAARGRRARLRRRARLPDAARAAGDDAAASAATCW